MSPRVPGVAIVPSTPSAPTAARQYRTLRADRTLRSGASFPSPNTDASLTTAFYEDPPFLNGHFGPRMGLRPIALDQWLPFAISTAERERKRALFATERARVYRSLTGADAALTDEHRAYGAVRDGAQTWIECIEDVAEPPLIRAALAIPDDLCVLRQAPGLHGSPGEYRLVAAALTSPSYWRLGDKLGQALSDIHRGIAGMPATLLGRMKELFHRLPDDRVLERRNWAVHGSQERFQPEPDRESATDDPTLPQERARNAFDWWIRSERQCLKRLAEGLVVFTIRVELHPLDAVVEYPDALRHLTTALARLAGDNLEEFGGRGKRDAISAALHRLSLADR